MRARRIIVATALVLVMACLAGLAPAAPERSARVCFPARSWDANDADRPCVSADAPQEDGSVRIVQGTPRGAASVCILPNPSEETGRYFARCWRPVPAAGIVQNNAAGFCVAPVAGDQPGTYYTRCYRR